MPLMRYIWLGLGTRPHQLAQSIFALSNTYMLPFLYRHEYLSTVAHAFLTSYTEFHFTKMQIIK